MDVPLWQIEFGDSPLVAAALHDGHVVRPEVARRMKIGAAARLHEEDPYTGILTSIAPTRIIAFRSRFELDLNRPRSQAVYLTPEDAWGLDVWQEPLPAAVLDGLLADYDTFYRQVRLVLEELVARFGRVVVFDLHTYNHRRDGAEGPLADPAGNPEVNVGTGTMHRPRWAPLVERFMNDVRRVDYLERKLDVRENVRFRGGYFPRWVHENFPETVCVLAVELKKFFMDEWSGELDHLQWHALREAMAAGAEGVREELERL